VSTSAEAGVALRSKDPSESSSRPVPLAVDQKFREGDSFDVTGQVVPDDGELKRIVPLDTRQW
jgi:hypothetical protein